MKKYLSNRNISIIYRYSQRFFAQKMKQYPNIHLEVGQFPSLMQVYRSPGITQDQISVRAGMDKGTTARSVKQLEQLGLIIRESDAKDRRINHIYPTQKALEMKQELFQVIHQLHDTLYQGMTDSEAETLERLLHRAKHNITEYMKDK